MSQYQLAYFTVNFSASISLRRNTVNQHTNPLPPRTLIKSPSYVQMRFNPQLPKAKKYKSRKRVFFDGSETANIAHLKIKRFIMPTIHYIDANETETDVEVSVGENLMQAALDNMVNGILGDCGGACACATCHVYVDDAWMGKLPPADDVEKDLLEMAVDPQENSRLGCQVVVTEDLDGLIVRLPVSQF